VCKAFEVFSLIEWKKNRWVVMICVRRNRFHIVIFPWTTPRDGPATKTRRTNRLSGAIIIKKYVIEGNLMGVNVGRLQPAKLLTYLHDDTYKLIKLYLNKASTNYTYFYDCIRAASRQFRQLFPRHANSRPRILLLSRDRIAETIKTNLTPFNGGGY
jgi:hypothetical protein